LLFDVPAEPPDGTYVRWRTYECSVIGGQAEPGGGEGDNAELVGVIWLRLHDVTTWPEEIRDDGFLYPQLTAIAAALSAERAQGNGPLPAQPSSVNPSDFSDTVKGNR
jgi:hypothetical protein